MPHILVGPVAVLVAFSWIRRDTRLVPINSFVVTDFIRLSASYCADFCFPERDTRLVPIALRSQTSYARQSVTVLISFLLGAIRDSVLIALWSQTSYARRSVTVLISFSRTKRDTRSVSVALWS